MSIHRFLKNREVISFALVEDVAVNPDGFVHTQRKSSKWIRVREKVTEQVLPDGTKHGKYFKFSSKDEWKKEKYINYRMGYLHGEYHTKEYNGEKYTGNHSTISSESTGQFEKGVPVGTFAFHWQNLGQPIKTHFLTFVNGLPMLFKGKTDILLIWEEDTVSINGEKYTNVVFFPNEKTPKIAIYPFLKDGWSTNVTSGLEKFSPEVYATNKFGQRVELHMPVFPRNIFK